MARQHVYETSDLSTIKLIGDKIGGQHDYRIIYNWEDRVMDMPGTYAANMGISWGYDIWIWNFWIPRQWPSNDGEIITKPFGIGFVKANFRHVPIHMMNMDVNLDEFKLPSGKLT